MKNQSRSCNTKVAAWGLRYRIIFYFRDLLEFAFLIQWGVNCANASFSLPAFFALSLSDTLLSIDLWRSVSCYGRILSYFKLPTVRFSFQINADVGVIDSNEFVKANHTTNNEFK